MIIQAERIRIEEDLDNNLWIVDFRDKERDKGLRGRIEIPSTLVDFSEIKDFEVEIQEPDKKPSTSDARLIYNAMTIRTRPTSEENVYSFSAGGLSLRLFSRQKIREFRPALRKYTIIVR